MKNKIGIFSYLISRLALVCVIVLMLFLLYDLIFFSHKHSYLVLIVPIFGAAMDLDPHW